ncbi:MAG: hypothetical protein M5U01_08065 [Ardenticatenaceae bacterium]|nr:hypothetical protein [Ardenticatenaceae bacterium]
MARDLKKRQKALERKAARRKQKQAKSRSSPGQVAPTSLRKAAAWPLHEVLLSKDWQTEGALVEILVARRSPLGQIAAGAYLVDLGCLGVKSALARLFSIQGEYETSLRRQILAHQSMMPADLHLVAKIIAEGLVYARELGFNPDPDLRHARVLLGDADPAACSVPVPLGGPEGKPFFVAGPYDNVPQIMARLTRAVGPDGFHYLIPIGPDSVDEE